MYFTDALRTLVRQLPIVIVGLALIVASCVVAFSVVPTNYQANAQVLLLPPTAPVSDGESSNPYLAVPGGLILTASLVASSVNARDTQRDLTSAGFRSAFAASVVPQTGPLILVTVQDTDPTAALRTRDQVLLLIADQLDKIQQAEDVPESQTITSRSFGVSKQAEVLAGNRLRGMAVIVALGSALTLWVAFTKDRWRRTRAVRSAEASEVELDPRWSAPLESASEGDLDSNRTDSSEESRPAEVSVDESPTFVSR